MLNKVKIAALVSGGGTNLQALIDAQASGVLKSGKIAAVISNREGAYALERARAAGIPAQVCLPKNYASNKEFEDALYAMLRMADAELIILAGFMRILGADFIKCYENRIINIHPSLIPSFCGKGFYGLKVHEAALNYGVKVTGATVHFVNEIPDGGKIILQKAVDILEGDTPETLQKRVMEQAEHIILPQAAELVSAAILAEKER